MSAQDQTVQKTNSQQAFPPSSSTERLTEDLIQKSYPNLNASSAPLLSSTQLFLRVAYLGLAFSLIFSGYHVAQAFVTTIYNSQGFLSLCIIYSIFAITSLFAPLMNQLMERRGGHGTGEKWTMALSGFGYVIFILTVASGSVEALFVGSVIKGVASGLLWISQGIWLTKLVTTFRNQHGNSDDSENIVGIATGVFFTLFNLNSIIGNLVVVFVLNVGATISTMMLSMGGIVTLGAILVVFSQNLPPVTLLDSLEPIIDMVEISQVLKSAVTPDPAKKQSRRPLSLTNRLWLIWDLTKQPRTFYLTPYLICQGVNMAYTFGCYPTFIEFVTQSHILQQGQTNDMQAQKMIALNIAYCFLSYGSGSMVGSFGWGKLYDFFNSKLYPLLLSHFMLVSISFSLLLATILSNISYPASFFPSLTSIGFIFGLVDFLTNAIINNSITRNYESSQVPLAFSWYRFCYCVGFAVASAIGAAVPRIENGGNGWIIMILINFSFMVLSVISGFVLELKISKKKVISN